MRLPIILRVELDNRKSIPMSAKRRTGARSRGVLALVLVLIGTNVGMLYYFLFYRQTVPAEDVPLEISDLMMNPENYIGQRVTVSGYYVIAAGNHSMLVENPLLFLSNSLDSSNYVRIVGDLPDTLPECAGLRCEIKGTVGWIDEAAAVLKLTYIAHARAATGPVVSGPYDDQVVEPLPLIEFHPVFSNPSPQKYAVLYSGGINPDYAYMRYWNDLVWMYFILIAYGYPADHIYVIYKDGVPEDAHMPVDYPATVASMQTVFNNLSATLTVRDSLFFFTTNHGGWDDIRTWAAMDDTSLNHTLVASWLDSITCNHMIIVMEQCFAGRFIPYISAPNRVVLTACGGTESWACDTEGEWDEFVYHFMCAVLGRQLNDYATVVDADINDDGRVSMREAYIYAAIWDSVNEIPQYDDNGDGIGLSLDSVINSKAGYGAGIFL